MGIFDKAKDMAGKWTKVKDSGGVRATYATKAEMINDVSQSAGVSKAESEPDLGSYHDLKDKPPKKGD